MADEESPSVKKSTPQCQSAGGSEKAQTENRVQGGLPQDQHQPTQRMSNERVNQADYEAGHSVHEQDEDSIEQKDEEHELKPDHSSAYQLDPASPTAKPALLQAPSGDSFKIQEQLTLKNYLGSGAGQSPYISAAQRSGKRLDVGSSSKSKGSLKSIRIHEETNRSMTDQAYREFSRSVMDDNRPTLHKDMNQKTHAILAYPPHLQHLPVIVDWAEAGERLQAQLEHSPLTDRLGKHRPLGSSLVALNADPRRKQPEDREPNTMDDSLFDSKETEPSMGKARRRMANRATKFKVDPSQARIDRLKKAIVQTSQDNFQLLSTQRSSIENYAQKLKSIVAKDFEGNFLESASKKNASPIVAPSEAQKEALSNRIFIGDLVPE